MRQAVIVAGPTCSGKSALALGLAVRLGGTVINADSMQVYRELRILTARPTPEEEAAPHRLYGVRAASEPGSVAWWRAQALAEMERASLPILCGGTGMYLQALTQGITDIPDPGPEARAEARHLLATEGAAGLHTRLLALDPVTAQTLRPSDGQRLARAWEVLRGTGQGLAAWQSRPSTPAPYNFRLILLDPPRAGLRQAISARFAAMLRAGAIDEVRALLALGLDPALPAMRAVGVPELASHLRGECTLDQAAERAVFATSRYIKRQTTWFRNRRIADPSRMHTIHARVPDWEQFSERDRADLLAFVVGAG